MATIETLIEQIGDKALREAVAREVGELKRRLDWGLVFERHLPENVRALAAPIRLGSVVWERRSATPRRLRVRSIEGEVLVVVAEPAKTTAPAEAPTERIEVSDVLVEQDFAEPVFPVPIPIGAVRNGPSDAPYHAVIQGENYHAIQALLAAYDRAFDIIYLDPPYNTGNRDWSYNNDYVDPADTFRPSKWLAFMERRLRIARRLLRPDGVLVVTVDENEVLHLGMLLDQMFRDARIQMVSIVINPNGVDRGGFARTDEFAFFASFGSAASPTGLGDDLLMDEAKIRDAAGAVRWERLLRGGASGLRNARGGANMFYPVLIDPDAKRVLGAGPSMPEGDPDLDALFEGHVAAWPIRTDGRFGQWHVGPDRLRMLIEQGFVRLGGYDPRRRTWTVYYVSDGTREKIKDGAIVVTTRDANGVVVLGYANVPRVTIKTVWNRKRHAAGVYGSSLLAAFLGAGHVFTFPKSLYAVRDTLEILTRDKRDALILDFFAGSGTTLHATMMLNAADGGSRRCVLVTNNELKAETATGLTRAGIFRGDPEFEAAGVFEAATRPRVTAAVTGVRPDGLPAEGEYLDGGRYDDGFAENVEFFRLDYLDPAEVEFGLRFTEIEPLLWLHAGGIGEREALDATAPLGLPIHSPYAVLFDPSGLPALLAALPERTDLTHVFIVSDSPESFAQIASDLPHGLEKVRLYRDYLETLRSATR